MDACKATAKAAIYLVAGGLGFVNVDPVIPNYGVQLPYYNLSTEVAPRPVILVPRLDLLRTPGFVPGPPAPRLNRNPWCGFVN